MNDQKYKDRLKRKGLKITKHRVKILKALDHASGAVTVEEIYIHLKETDSAVCLSTIYRSLETLCKKELITKANLLNDTLSRYEYNRLEHKHHLVCTNCNQIYAVTDCPVHEYVCSLPERIGFESTSHKLEIYGICANCMLGNKA